MKKINLTFTSLPDKSSWLSSQKTYSVYLGNEITTSFTSEKKVKKFLADTNRFLNLQMNELNQIYIQFFAEYRRLWFIIDFEDSIEDSIRDINRFFKKILKSNSGVNGNFFVFIDFMRLTKELTEAIEKLQEFQKENNNYTEVNQLATLLLRCNNIDEVLKNYGKEYQQDHGQV
jgi:hypothetical protein